MVTLCVLLRVEAEDKVGAVEKGGLWLLVAIYKLKKTILLTKKIGKLSSVFQKVMERAIVNISAKSGHTDEILKSYDHN